VAVAERQPRDATGRPPKGVIREHAAQGRGEPLAPAARGGRTARHTGGGRGRTTLKELIAGLEADYQANGRRSLGRVKKALKHVRAHFGEDRRVVELTSDRITAYTAARLEAGAAPATVNRELAALKRMLRLGERAGTVLRRPHIAMLEERNARRGFFEADQVRALLGHLPAYLQPVIAAAAATGWRELRAGLERLREATDKLECAQDRVIPWVFHRDGQPIRDFRTAWRKATKAAGLIGRIPHDFRRTSVRNLERAGVPRSAAMKMVGHQTESIYRRYAIVDEAMLRDAGARLAAFVSSMDQVRTKSGRVTPLLAKAVAR
jgi:integrase